MDCVFDTGDDMTQDIKDVLKLALEWAEAHGEIVFAGGGMDAVNKMNSWVAAIKEALREHAMREVQRLGQEIEQEPVAHWSDCAVHSEPAYPKGECDCGGFKPTAWLVEDVDGSHLYWKYKEPIGNEKWTPLFSTPPQRTWVGLTDEEKSELWEISRAAWPRYITYASLAEAKLKERNT